ncbi:MAG: metallophosphoesterase [Myxococcaceae bacterium]
MSRLRRLAVIVVLAAAAGPGCSCDPAGIVSEECSADSECAPGERCRAGLCVMPPDAGCALAEVDCANASDDDCDGLSDCADPDCAGHDCASSGPCTMAMCSGSTCAEQLRPAGTECRPLSGNCDFAEVCTGDSAECPSETYLPEGSACGACQTCDGIGGCNPSADGTACGIGISCLSGECVGCGDAAEPCCEGGLCNGALVCDEGTCGAADAGAPDAGSDAGVPDAGAPDAGVDAGPVVRVTVVMSGDIVQSGATTLLHARQNAALINAHVPKPRWIMAIGDNARYSSGATISLLTYYQTYWKPAAAGNWGQFDPIMFPVPGNHEYNEANAKGYYDYFASRFTAIAALPSYHGFAGTLGKGYYSFDINGWHFIGLNSDCSAITGGCAVGGAQYVWLKADLAAHAGKPIVAYWHHPRYFCNSGSPAGSISSMQPFWAALYDARADFLFAGHLHVYERFKAMNKAQPAVVDLANGVTQIIVGDSGVSSGGVCAAATDPRIAKQIGGDGGIGSFFFTVGSDGSYSFKYVLLNGTVFDSGSGWSRHRP